MNATPTRLNNTRPPARSLAGPKTKTGQGTGRNTDVMVTLMKHNRKLLHYRKKIETDMKIKEKKFIAQKARHAFNHDNVWVQLSYIFN
jgi:hypothetical protein